MLSLPLLKDQRVLRREILASLVVFLVALPLCVGVAVASGVPAELGLVTG
ncbi:SulP family inorganic anion transporter, partial [Streptomyces sp. NPDC102264]